MNGIERVVSATLAAKRPPSTLRAAPDQAHLSRSVFVTGTTAAGRPGALKRCSQHARIAAAGKPVLACDSGLAYDSGVAYSSGVAAMAGQALGWVACFADLDRLTDIRKHGVQGRRDRPHDLVAQFQRGPAISALAKLGIDPGIDRPRLYGQETGARAGGMGAVTADGDRDERYLQALLAVGVRCGLRVALPPSPSQPGDASLNGLLCWSAVDRGWNAEWTLAAATWTSTSLSFDEAFRAGVGGAAARLPTP